MARKRSILSILLRLALLFVVALASLPATQRSTVAYAQTSTIHLRVQSARAWVPAGLAQGDAIPNYKWLIVRDDTGETDPNYPGATTDCKPQSLGGDPAYPANCKWPSRHSTRGGTAAVDEVVASGDQSDWNQTTGLDFSALGIGPGKYMVSVMAGGFDTSTGHVDGFKIDGQWFSVPMADPGLVTVDMQPYPLPLTTLRAQVFFDTSTNGEFDTGEPPLAGWQAHISDVLGEVTTDWYGNPICTEYQHDTDGNIIFDSSGAPTILHTGGHCYSDANGVVTIKYLGPDRYSMEVAPPNGQTWYQTSSLEGGLDWDIWAQEGWNGYDPEFVPFGDERFPFAIFGFVPPTYLAGHPDMPTTGGPQYGGRIKGTAVKLVPYSPPANGIPFGGEAGNKIRGPVDRPIVAVIDTLRNDQVVWVGRGNSDGSFQINGVQDGDYLVSYWDKPANMLIESVLTKVVNGQMDDLGVLDSFPWFPQSISGRVCNDLNRNGKCETGEPGIQGILVDLLSRDNSLQDQGQASAITDANGNYEFTQAYPLGQWVVEQVYDERFYTVGVTYQTDNQPTPTTVMANGGFVDVSTFNQVGLSTHFDWALHRYENPPIPPAEPLGPTNGGIVGTVWYASTRNETDARFQANEDYEAGISGLNMHLYAPVPCDPATAGPLCVVTTTPNGTSYYMLNSDGSYMKGPELNDPYVTETWARPVNCVARDVNGDPVQQQLLPPSTGDHECLEAPLMANQVGNNDFGVGMLVNGNFGFVTINKDPTTGADIPEEEIPPGDYLVDVEIPNDALGRPMFKPVEEEDINVYTGDEFVAPGETPVNPPAPVQQQAAPPQPTPQVPPFLCAGALHTVDVAGVGTDNYPQVTLPDGVTVPASAPMDNPGFVDAGGSPYEGQQKPACGMRLVTVQSGKSATPNFHFFTDVPMPTRIHGLITDDLNLSTDPKDLFYGEKAGIPNIPIGIYDFANRLMTTIHTDPDGVYEVLLPSTSSYNCPLPAGPCPGVYRLVANDHGLPGHLNADHNQQYRTLSIFQQAWPNLTLPSDLAPLPVSTAVEGPGTQNNHMTRCLLNDPTQTTALNAIPELFAVDKPLVRSTETGSARNITIKGQYFGSAGQVTLTNGPVKLALTVGSWSDSQITVAMPPTSSDFPAGPYQMQITRGDNGQHTVNGLSIHVLGAGYNPTLFEVGPGKTYDPTSAASNSGGYEHSLQDALNAAAGVPQALVVVYPHPGDVFNPHVYYENIVIHSPVKVQGVGPGGVRDADHSTVPGSVIDGTGFGHDTARDDAWETLVGSLPIVTHPTPPEAVIPGGETIFVVATGTTQYTSGYKAAIDGLAVQGGDVLDFVANLSDDGGLPENSLFDPIDPFFATGTEIQGAGIVAWDSTQYLQITNDIIRNNSGAYAGGIRIGTSYVGDNNLDGIRIGNDRIIANGGSNLAGQIGIFAGADGYEIDHNDICGGFSAEYGGGISHFGLNGPSATGAPNKIHDNRIYFNGSYDEGAGIMIAGELPLPPGSNQRVFDDVIPPPPPPSGLSPGAGPVDIYNNIIQSNLSGDDGGGLRFLMAGPFQYNVYNNMIANNIATHEGAGVALDDAPNLRFYNNTIMKSLTTATSQSSNGDPTPAGLSTQLNSVNLQDFLVQNGLPGAGSLYSNPLQFNNLFCDNRAGRWDGANIIGIANTNVALQQDPNPINFWDMGSTDVATNLLQPTNSLLQPTSNPGVTPDGSNNSCPAPNSGGNQGGTNNLPPTLTSVIKTPFETQIQALPWRGDGHFVGNVTIALDLPQKIMGDYHLSGTGSPANNAGAASKSGVNAPPFDIDYDGRPSDGGFEIGADEILGAVSPATAVLDTFNRANGALGGNWGGDTSTSIFSIFDTTPSTPSTGVARVTGNGAVWWNAATFGANQEAFFTFAKVVPSATEQALLLKCTCPPAPPSSNARWIRVRYNATQSRVLVETKAPGQGVVLRATIIGVTFATGDRFGARALTDGSVLVYKNGILIGIANVATGPTPWPAANVAGGGKIAVEFARSGGFAVPNDARFDNFGGGTTP